MLFKDKEILVIGLNIFLFLKVKLFLVGGIYRVVVKIIEEKRLNIFNFL